MSFWTHSQTSDRRTVRRCCPLIHPPSQPPLLLQTCGPRVGGWIRPTQQFRMGKEGKEWRRGGMSSDSYPDMSCVPETRRNNGHWQLMWKYSHRQFLTCSVCVCVWGREGGRERIESCDLAAETRWSELQMESVEQSRSRKNQGYVSPHTGSALLCCVVV